MKHKTTPILRYNAYAREYEKALRAFSRSMCKSIEYHVIAALRRNGIISYDAYNPQLTPFNFKVTLKKLLEQWQSNADDIAAKLTDKQLRRLVAYVNRRYTPILGAKAKINTARLKQLIKARYYENVALIKSIPQETIRRYESVLYSAITGGDEYTIRKNLEVIKGISERRAITIARDQTAKALEAINIARCEQMGLKYYEWHTAEDERVSTGKGGHKQLNGKIFRYDKPEAIIDSYGNRGHPAQRVNCRCIALGVFLEPGQSVKRAKDGYGYVVV